MGQLKRHLWKLPKHFQVFRFKIRENVQQTLNTNNFYARIVCVI